jgi:hypothetical protein
VILPDVPVGLKTAMATKQVIYRFNDVQVRQLVPQQGIHLDSGNMLSSTIPDREGDSEEHFPDYRLIH